MANIGIDFGTTNSALVSYDKEKNEFLYFNFNEDLTKPKPVSSTIWYHDDTITIGSNARQNINTYSGIDGHHFEKSIKSKLKSDIGINIFGQSVPPFIIAGEIIKYLKNQAATLWMAEKLGVNLNSAVFTIPLNFNGLQRNALRKAANEAGIEVTTFIHEPFAAVVGYFFSQSVSQKQIMNNLDNLNGKFYLVFDWGGGTLDITVVKIEDGKMIEFGTSELSDNAGDKFDEDIANWVWNKFIEKNKEQYDISFLEKNRKDNWDRIVSASEEAKIVLSTQESYFIRVDNITDDLSIEEKITLEIFNSLIENTVQNAINEIDKAIREANIGEVNIDQVLLTGGTCYIPYVQEKLKEKFGHRVVLAKDADLIIAKGAAVISEMGWLPFLAKDISIQLSDDSLYPIFEKNMNIASNKNSHRTEDLICCDNRGGFAKIIIVEADGQRKERNLDIIKVPVQNYSFSIYNDPKEEIKLDAVLDKDIILKLTARGFLVKNTDIDSNKEYSEQRSTEVHNLRFGLDYLK